MQNATDKAENYRQGSIGIAAALVGALVFLAILAYIFSARLAEGRVEPARYGNAVETTR